MRMRKKSIHLERLGKLLDDCHQNKNSLIDAVNIAKPISITLSDGSFPIVIHS